MTGTVGYTYTYVCREAVTGNFSNQMIYPGVMWNFWHCSLFRYNCIFLLLLLYHSSACGFQMNGQKRAAGSNDYGCGFALHKGHWIEGLLHFLLSFSRMKMAEYDYTLLSTLTCLPDITLIIIRITFSSFFFNFPFTAKYFLRNSIYLFVVSRYTSNSRYT